MGAARAASAAIAPALGCVPGLIASGTLVTPPKYCEASGLTGRELHSEVQRPCENVGRVRALEQLERQPCVPI